MTNLLALIIAHLMNWVLATFAFALCFPQYEHIAGAFAFPLTVLALGCAVLIAILSLLSKEA